MKTYFYRLWLALLGKELPSAKPAGGGGHGEEK